MVVLFLPNTRVFGEPVPFCASYVNSHCYSLHDAILTRLSNDDDLEKSLSTFASEMTTSAMILGMATPMSLVLVDELGRGTSPRDGIGISHAIAEALIATKVCASHVFMEVRSDLRWNSVLYFSQRQWNAEVSFIGSRERFRHYQELKTTLSRQPTVIKCEVQIQVLIFLT